MAKLARLPGLRRAAERDAAAAHGVPRLRTRFYAFLSYSHKDKDLADWLHRELEHFRVPSALAGKLTANGVVPRRLTPIFRDQHDLPAGDDLAVEIEAALAASQFLVVLCSPTAAKSRWTNLEIESFKRTRPEGCVLAAVVAGEPFASDIKGREDEECFPPALRYKYDRRGHQTSKRAEPLAADFREAGEGRRLAFLKLVAGMLGVGLDELVQRNTTRRHRQLAYVAAASLAGMAVTSTLAVTAIQARDAARDQRREAEGLIGFMLGDLKDKLEPIGRLDALDGVGSRVLAYYQKQGTSDLSDAALSQRSRALSLMGEVAYQRGDLLTSQRLYREALQGTAEAIRRNPSDPQRIYDHAQNAYWLGDIAIHRDDPKSGEAWWREYKRLASQMITLAPDNMKWRMEGEYADADLGIVLYNERQFAEAAAHFQQALATIQALASADPHNGDYQKSMAQALAWLADSKNAQGQIGEAVRIREQHLALLQRLARQSGNDAAYQQMIVVAERGLGNLNAELGQTGPAMTHFNNSVEIGKTLVSRDPTNTYWLDVASVSKLRLADYALETGQPNVVSEPLGEACRAYSRLFASHRDIPAWQDGARYCLVVRAEAALEFGNKSQAVQLATQAVRIARAAQTADPSDAFKTARALRTVGDAYRANGNSLGAKQAWALAAAAIPRGVPELPGEMAEQARILERLGGGAELNALNARLSAIGYRNSTKM
jgi:tetratricopeptide (TPR) repeat protein